MHVAPEAVLELATRLWPDDVARVQTCVRCARQPSTLFGSPEDIIEAGVDEASEITSRWADVYAEAVASYDHGTQIARALERASKSIDLGPLVTTVFERTMRALMLGAVDAEWEASVGEAIALPRFTVQLPGAFPAPNTKPLPSPSFVSRPYEKAVEWFRAKKVMPRAQFDALSDAVKRKAFTVAGLANKTMLLATREELAKRVAGGADLRDFKKFAKDRLISAGWTPSSPSHVETIFRTNVMGTYGAGRFAQMSSPNALALRPYWQILTVNDGPPRQRSTHRAVHGWVLRADDQIWAKLWTPFGFNCRCRIRSISEAQLRRLGVELRSGDQILGLPDPGFVSGVGKLISPGVLTPVKALPPTTTPVRPAAKTTKPTIPPIPPATSPAPAKPSWIRRDIDDIIDVIAPPKEYSKATAGVHVGEIECPSGFMDRDAQHALLDDITDTRILSALQKKPVQRLVVQNAGLGPFGEINGFYEYVPSGRWNKIEINGARLSDTYGKKLVPGRTWSISSTGERSFEAAKRTLCHEIGHHVHTSGGPEVDAIIRKAAAATKSPITEYAAQTHREYFAESFTAYRYNPAELKAHDSIGFQMVEDVLALVGKVP